MNQEAYFRNNPAKRYNRTLSSPKLYSELSQDQIDYLNGISSFDYAIYTDKSLFWDGVV